jgi:enamine deaminase RidA (YjgF/YER057c/UK114 family)
MKQILDPGWPVSRQFAFSQAVRVGDLVIVSGQMPVDPDGTLLHPGDVVAQARVVFDNMAAVLAAGDLTLAHVVELVSYHTDFRDIGDFAAVKGEYFTEDPPAWTSIGVAALAIPGQRLEVKATAYAG